jgi:hypothetical protein
MLSSPSPSSQMIPAEASTLAVQIVEKLAVGESEALTRQGQITALAAAAIKSGLPMEVVERLAVASVDFDSGLVTSESFQELGEHGVPAAMRPAVIEAFHGLRGQFLDGAPYGKSIASTGIAESSDRKLSSVPEGLSADEQRELDEVMGAAPKSAPIFSERFTETGYFEPALAAALYKAFSSELRDAGGDVPSFNELLERKVEVAVLGMARYPVLMAALKEFNERKGSADLGALIERAAGQSAAEQEFSPGEFDEEQM